MNNQKQRWSRNTEVIDKNLKSHVDTVMAMYDWTGIDKVTRGSVRSYVWLELGQYRLSYLSLNLQEIVPSIAFNTYDVLGLVPTSMREEMPKWLDWACKCGHDGLAFRLLNDGVDPNAHSPRCWSAATRIRKNREAMPKSWAWLCQRELAKTAAKARKRSWASGALVEPRAL